MNNDNIKMSGGLKIFIAIVVICVMIIIGKLASGEPDDRCHYSGCNNPVYSYKGNLNGYCEKHRQEYDNWKAMQDLKKYLDSID